MAEHLRFRAQSDVECCPCCGEVRPYPKNAGEWEYRRDPAINYIWNRVSIVQTEVGLVCIPEGNTEPIWWPTLAAWRKVTTSDGGHG
jgi:hypothetical protein